MNRRLSLVFLFFALATLASDCLDEFIVARVQIVSIE
jgi:hypothetical protein